MPYDIFIEIWSSLIFLDLSGRPLFLGIFSELFYSSVLKKAIFEVSKKLFKGEYIFFIEFIF